MKNSADITKIDLSKLADWSGLEVPDYGYLDLRKDCSLRSINFVAEKGSLTLEFIKVSDINQKMAHNTRITFNFTNFKLNTFRLFDTSTPNTLDTMQEWEFKQEGDHTHLKLVISDEITLSGYFTECAFALSEGEQ